MIAHESDGKEFEKITQNVDRHEYCRRLQKMRAGYFFRFKEKNSPNTHFNKGSKRSWHCSAVCLVWQFIKLVALTKTHGGAYGLAFVAVLLLERVAQRRRIRTAFGLNFLGKKS